MTSPRSDLAIGLATAMALGVSSAYAADQTGATPATNPAACHVANWSSFDAIGAGSSLLAGTTPAAINDVGEIAGSWVDVFLVSHGFLRRPNGTTMSFDPPNVSTAHGGGGTTVLGLNNRGEIVGSYWDAQSANHGFIRAADGSFTVVDDPDPSAAATYLSGINDWGVAVGGWSPANGAFSQGFVRHADGSISNIAGSFALLNINDLGEASGVTSTGSSGLLLQHDGKRVIWAPPQATSLLVPSGLNMAGSVAAFYFDAQEQPHGFVRHENGHFTMVATSSPSYNAVRLGSINNHGTVVGYETGAGGQQGFAQLASGTRVPVSAPVTDQQATTPVAINDKNVLTGSWHDPGTGLTHGFVATLVSCH